MKNFIYTTINTIGQSVRKRNYSLYRKIVENRIFYFFISKLFHQKTAWIKTPEGINLCINPIYHGQFMTETAIEQYEEQLKALFDKIVKPGMIVYDIGANVGVFSVFFATKVSPGGKVYSFEPEVNNTTCLKETCRKNRIENLMVIEKCVSDSSGTKLFDHRGGAFSGKIVEADSASTSNHHKLSEQVSISLDDFVFKQQNLFPDLVKIDVEGHEAKVFQGMVKILGEHKTIIICELHHGLCDSIPEIFRILHDNGYQCYDVDAYLKGNEKVLHSLDQAHHILAKATHLAFPTE